MHDAGEIERLVAAFARAPSSGLIVTAGGPAYGYRELIVTLAARQKLAAVYFERVFVTAGGLVSMGRITSTSIVTRPAMSIASSRARSQQTSRCRRRPGTS